MLFSIEQSLQQTLIKNLAKVKKRVPPLKDVPDEIYPDTGNETDEMAKQDVE